MLLTAVAGSARITQLRATARKYRRTDHRAVKAEDRDSSKARRSPDYREPATGCGL